MWRAGSITRLLTAITVASAAAFPWPALARDQVDLELILMADASGSVDDEEFTLQRRGYAQALRDPRVIDAIRNGRLGRIALSYVEWSGPDLQDVIVPWTTIATAADIAIVAHRLENVERMLYGGGTAIGHALIYAANSVTENTYDGRRLVIDLSGDDANKDGLAASMGRDYAVGRGITVNGLAILEWSPGLDSYFHDNVVGGPGAFVVRARNFKDFAVAIRRKLIREIADHGGARPQGRGQGRVVSLK